MKYFLLLLALNIFTGYSQSDSTATIYGVLVSDKNDMPLYNVHVYIETDEGRFQTKSDFDGLFIMDELPLGRHTIYLRMFSDTTTIVVNVLTNDSDLGTLKAPFPMIIGCVCPIYDPNMFFGVADPLKPTTIGEEDLRHSIFR